MKSLFVVLSLMLSLTTQAFQAVDFSPLQLQLRFEDTSAQTKETVSYQSLSANYQKDFFRVGFGYSSHSDETGNSSLHIETKKTDYLVNAGYHLFSLFPKDSAFRLDIFAEALIGITQSTVATTLLGSTTSANSNNDLVYGPGAAAIFRYSYFLLESDFQVLGSKAYAPQYVPVFIIKAGVSFPLP